MNKKPLNINYFVGLMVIGLLFFLPSQAQEATEDEDGKLIFMPKIVDISETYIGAHFGVAMPMDDFRRVNPSAESGFAQMGYKAGLDGSFIFFRNMGLGWTFGYAVNPFDVDAYLRSVYLWLPKSIEVGNVSGTATADNWRSTWLTIGPYVSLPEEKFMFDIGMYLGLAYTDAPKITFIGQAEGQNLINEVRSDGSISTAFLIQGSGNWFVKENLRVFVKGEMLFARPELRREVTTEMETFYLKTTADENQSVGLLNLAAGIAYEFDNKKSRKRTPKVRNKKAQDKKKKQYLKKKNSKVKKGA